MSVSVRQMQLVLVCVTCNLVTEEGRVFVMKCPAWFQRKTKPRSSVGADSSQREDGKFLWAWTDFVSSSAGLATCNVTVVCAGQAPPLKLLKELFTSCHWPRTLRKLVRKKKKHDLAMIYRQCVRSIHIMWVRNRHLVGNSFKKFRGPVGILSEYCVEVMRK